MSSLSSCSETLSASRSSWTSSSRPARPASMRMLASVTRRAKRSGRMAASARCPGRPAGALPVGGRGLGLRGAGGAHDGVGDLGLAGMALHEERDALAQLLQELRRPDHPRVLTQAQHPGDELTGVGIGRDEEHVVVIQRADLAVAAEVALDLPGDAAADPHLGGPDRLPELPVDPVGVGARIEVVGTLEVVLGLGGVPDLAPDAREAEDADGMTLMGAADDIELATLVQELVGVHASRADLVALHGVVLEDDRLAAEDGGLDLGQALGHVVAAG
jgi:hypothetical protein